MSDFTAPPEVPPLPEVAPAAALIESPVRPMPAALATTARSGKARPVAAPHRTTVFEIRRLDLWSVLKFATVFYGCLFLVFLVAGVGLWLIASAVGVLGNVESFVGSLLSARHFHFLGVRILQATVLGGFVLVALASGFTVLAAVFYNLITDLVGGVQLAVTEDERGSTSRI